MEECDPNDTIGKPLPGWQKGWLDIHHINTGGGDWTYIVMPDGTTVLLDAGEIGDSMREEYEKKYLHIAPRPHAGDKSAAATAGRYIRQLNVSKVIDCAIITHFHADHYGFIDESSKESESGKYRVSGVSEIDQEFPIQRLFDRGHTFPLDLKEHYKTDPTFTEYLKFIEFGGKSWKMKREQLVAGAKDQVTPTHSPIPDFSFRCVKSSERIWTGTGVESRQLFDSETVLVHNARFNENPLSMAVLLSFGNFRYFSGGDMTGLDVEGTPGWIDTESPTTEVVGGVDVTTLNHHGNRDGSNINFVRNLQPRVIVQQSWCSDHPGQESFYRLVNPHLYPGPRDLFATYIHDNILWSYGRKFVQSYKSMRGHIVVRVSPGGIQYCVYILDDTVDGLVVKALHGPYISKGPAT